MKLIISGRLDGLNEYTNANRQNRYAGAGMKKRNEEIITYAIKNQNITKTKAKVKLTFSWYEPNTRRDLDNICFAKKFILDALVKNGILENDNWKCVEGFTDEFYVDSINPRVEVTIDEIRE